MQTSGHRPRKRFGQHFLHDPAVVSRIIAAIAPRSGDHLLEIGPGPGVLTRPLLAAGVKLDAVEIDRDLAAALVHDLTGPGTPGEGRLTVHSADALTFDICALAGGRRLRAVGNLPYNISTPLLFHLLAQLACIGDMHFMLQKEVVDRMAARPGTDAYGRLSIMVQYHCEVEPLFTIGPGAFRPPPKVESAFVRLRPHARAPVQLSDYAALEQVVKQAFSYRRKTLRNALKGVLGPEDFTAADVDPGLRPEQLGLAEFARLADRVARREE